MLIREAMSLARRRPYRVRMRLVMKSPTAADAGLAAAIVAWTALATWLPGHAGGTPIAGPLWLRILYPLLIGVPFVWRRRAPLAAVLGFYAGLLLQAGVTADSPEGLWLIVAFSVLSYSVAAHSARRLAFAGLAVVLVGYVLYAWADRGVRRWDPGNAWAAGFFAAVIVAWWLLGLYIRHRREEQRNLAHTKALQEQARDAVDQERARLARELHDVISHNLSVVVVQAAGARASGATDPTTLEKIERSGRESLVEMRRLLGVLRRERDDGPDLKPQPGIAHLPDLAAGVRSAGVPVELKVEGDAAGLPGVLDLCAYRIVQESLTNVVKHAGSASACVTVRCDPQSVTIDVVDNGVGPTDVSAGGHGLVGMRERVAIFGGELTTGPRPGGGFAVHAWLPRDGEAT